MAWKRSYIEEGDLLDVDGIDGLGTRNGRRVVCRRRSGRVSIIAPVRLDLYHFLFSADSPATEETKATAVVVGRTEEGRQGGYDVRNLGHHHQYRERDGDVADCRQYQDQNA